MPLVHSPPDGGVAGLSLKTSTTWRNRTLDNFHALHADTFLSVGRTPPQRIFGAV